jgi:hypothetical protein
MKYYIFGRSFLSFPFKWALSLLLLTGFYSVQAQSDYLVRSVTGSVSGTSTLHSWKSSITKVQVKGALKKTGNTLTSVKNVVVKIPVTGIISTEGKSMDKKTYQAFKSDKNPFILYTFNTAQVQVNAAHEITIEASGSMTMAGTTLPEDLTATGKVLDNGDLEFSISKKLKMTSFNMKPPTALLGTIKSGDEITLNFDLVLTQVKAVAAK